MAVKFLEKNRASRYARSRLQRLLGRAAPAAGRAAKRERDRRSLLHPESLGSDPDERLFAQEFEPLEPLMVGDQRQIQRPSGDLKGEVR